MSEPYIPNDGPEQPYYGRPKAFRPTEPDRARVTRNLFHLTRDYDSNLNSVLEIRSGAKANTDIDDHVANVNTVGTTWVYQYPRPNVVDSDSHRPIVSSRIISSDQTYPKLLPTVELFSPPPISMRSTVAYPARAGAGYRVNRPDGTYEYRYFEPIFTEPNEILITRSMKGGALHTGHGAISDQRHIDPLLGVGASSLNCSRTQCETAHSTGTPKFCGNTGAARETSSLNRGNDYTHAPARLSATL